MYQSKVTIVKGEQWDNFSVFNTSRAKNTTFIPIPCPTHSDYSITNICKSPGCIEPLCPECITAHVQLHEQTKKPAKIQNIINTRLGCIDRLSQILQQLNSNIQRYESNSLAILDNPLIKSQKSIEFAKKKIYNYVQRFFQELQEKYQLLAVAYLNLKQRKTKEIAATLAPLVNQIHQITQYKNQLQSEDYIPALIELLHDPPKKPPLLKELVLEKIGQIKVDQFAFESFKTSVQSFITVQSLLPPTEGNKFAELMNGNGSKFSNQMRFSKIGRSSSRQLIESHLENSKNQSRVSRSNSRKKIFSNQKRDDSISGMKNSNVIPSRTAKQLKKEVQKIKITFEANQVVACLIDCNYFAYDKGYLAYFPPSQKHFYAIEAICADRGFERYQLPQFQIPHDHQCVVTPDSKIFLMGGRIESKFLNDSYEVVMKLSRNNPSIKNIAAMNEARAKFATVFHNQDIFAFGGRKGGSLLNSCERYNILLNKWEGIKNMPQALMSMNVCSFNDKIFKFGGILQNGQILNRIDLYLPEQNEWLMFPSQIPFFIKMGSNQLNKTQLLIYGGQTQFNTKKNECFLLRQERRNQYKMYQCSNTLYNEGSFESAYTYKNSILGIQNGEDNKSKVIMKFELGKWRFLSC